MVPRLRPAGAAAPAPSEFLLQGVDALIILGKRLTSRSVIGSELAARSAAAAWLYHSGLAPRLVCVEGEINRPHHPAGSAIAAELLEGWYGVPGTAITARSWSDCTRVEVRGIRVLARAHGWRRLAAITAGYHAWRVQRLYRQVGLEVAVLPCRERALSRLIPPADPALYVEWVVPAIRAARLPATKRLEEWAKEAVLLALVGLDRQGVVERTLARRLRHRDQPWVRSAG